MPFLWQYADRFALFDNFHMTVDGPSTPNAIAMIAGQGGETQYVKHPDQVANEPVTGDPGPFPGSNLDKSAVKPTFNAGDENPNKPTIPQTYASLPLSFMGPQIQNIIKADENPTLDLLDVQNDIGRPSPSRTRPTSPGAGTRRATTTTPSTRVRTTRPRRRATSSTTTGRSISAMSATTLRSCSTCTGSVTSIPI